MSTFVRFGRWEVELYQRAIHVVRDPKPHPKCAHCGGTGGHGYITEGGDGDWEFCQCRDPRTWRLPYWPRSTKTQEYPF